MTSTGTATEAYEQPTASQIGFDPAALKQKYLEERDKRLRLDANEQYLEIKGQFAHFMDDPYIEAPIDRSPLTDEKEIVIVGGGFGGLLAGARLRGAGFEDVRIIEKGGAFGGTWYWNRYPGAACDIESYIYLPLLEETGFMPERRYSQGPEILRYSNMIAEKYDLHRDALFQTEVTDLTWDEGLCRWIVSTNHGDAIRARFVLMANGPLHKPKLPGIPGIEKFKGHTFHTSRWDYGYTGGGSDGGLDRLGDKVVGIIGTGATAVQVVPHLGAGAKELYVFQRTPSSVDVRNDRPTDMDWANSLEPGWQKRRMENFNILVSGGIADEDLVADGWTELIRNLGVIARMRANQEETPVNAGELVQLADFQKMESIRHRIDSTVSDKSVAEALKPYYNQFCKRPCFHDDYLPTFNRPNVHLVDTDGRGVEGITERGVVVAGREYPLDCLIFATGFEFGTSYARRAGYQVHGRGGKSLEQKWDENGARTFHGLMSHDFPNCFIFSMIQSGQPANFPHALAEQSTQVAYILSEARSRGSNIVECTVDAEEAWTKEVLDVVQDRRKFLEECTPGYYNGEGGKPDPRAATFGPYGAGSPAFFNILERWRESGTFEGIEFR